MADSNFEAQRMAELMAEVNDQLARYGQVHPQTQAAYTDALMKSKLGIHNYTEVTKLGAKAVGELGKSATAAAKAMLDGEKGAKAFNSTIDGITSAASTATDALGKLHPSLKILSFVVDKSIQAYGAYTKAANKMSDELYAGYTKMQKAGGAASDGMSGLFRDAKKLGLSMNELDGFTQIVADNSRDFALLAGSVSAGRKQFASIGESIAPYRESLLAMGMSMDEINDGMAGYLKLQSRVGLSQNKTTEQLAEGARKYLLEQDALTRVTGQTRKDAEASREEFRSQERFAAKLMQVRREQGEAFANELEIMVGSVAAYDKRAGQGLADILTGYLQTEAAQESFRATQGKSMVLGEQVVRGQMKGIQAGQEVAKLTGATADAIGESMGKMAVYNSYAGDLAGALRLKAAAAGDFAGKYQQQLADQAAGGDAAAKNQGKLIKAQQDANKGMETFIANGILPAQEKMIMFANAAGWAAEKLANISGKATAGEGAMSMVGGAALTGFLAGLKFGLPGAAIGAGIGAIAGGAAYYLPKMAVGGITNGPSLAGEAGTEAVVPLPNGRSIPVSFTGDQNSTATGGTDLVTSTKFSQVRNELLKDNIALAKLTDRQLIDQRRYNAVLSNFHRMSIEQMQEQMGDISQEDIQQILDSATSGLASAAGGSAAGVTSDTGVRMSRIVDAAGKLLETRVGGHRNWRNNNPGNIQYGDFAVSMGAIGSDGRFAIFPDMEMGYKAADALMKSKNYQNLTIGEAIKRWAPPSENDTGAYQRTFQKAGFDMGAKYSDMNPAMQRKYLETKMRMEGGQAGQVVSGSSAPTAGGAVNVEDLFNFGSGSGSKSNFEQLDGGFKSAVIKAAEEYNAATGKKLQINSAKRDSDDQARLYNAWVARGMTGMPVGKPGTSRHEHGMAVDIQNYGDSQAVAALNRQGLYQKVPNDPVHFQFANGGISRGPRSGYLAKLHGREAVVPLPDGRTIPVSIQGLEYGKMFDTLKSDMGNMLSQVRDVLSVVSQKMDNATMIRLMDEMVRVQKSSVDIQNKMLKAQA